MFIMFIRFIEFVRFIKFYNFDELVYVYENSVEKARDLVNFKYYMSNVKFFLFWVNLTFIIKNLKLNFTK